MPIKLSTTISKVSTIGNGINVEKINEFIRYMKDNGSSERHQNNNLKVIIYFANFLGLKVSFYDINNKEQIIKFLDTKIKNSEEDPDKRWVTTWNSYLNRIRLFYRWLYNINKNKDNEYWETPQFVRIKTKKTNRISPYLESEIWERDELLSIIKYETHKRNRQH